jgi:hypothetical protein
MIEITPKEMAKGLFSTENLKKGLMKSIVDQIEYGSKTKIVFSETIKINGIINFVEYTESVYWSEVQKEIEKL